MRKLLIILTITLNFAPTFACTCKGKKFNQKAIKKAIEKSETIFIGKAIKSTGIVHTATGKDTITNGAVFKAEKFYKGEASEIIQTGAVPNKNGSIPHSSCDFSFKMNHYYIVFIRNNSVSLCSPTSELTEKEYEKLFSLNQKQIFRYLKRKNRNKNIK